MLLERLGNNEFECIRFGQKRSVFQYDLPITILSFYALPPSPPPPPRRAIFEIEFLDRLIGV